MRGARQIAAALSGVWLVSCQRAILPAPAVEVGTASYVVLTSPEEAVAGAAAKRGANDAGEPIEAGAADFFQAATPRGLLAPPRYPRELLRPGARAVVVTVRVRIDAEGAVREIAGSPAGVSTLGRDEASFWEAIRAAAKRWRFEPARVLHATLPKEAGAVPGLRSETVESTLDLQFTFVP